MKNELKKIQPQGSVFASDNSYERAMNVAKQLASSDLVPDTYKKNPANCVIALDVARQVRSSPLIVMQNLNIIKGKPSWSSTYIAAAIRTRFKNIKVDLCGEGPKRGCQVVAYDDNSDVLAEGARVTMEMAKLEGWIDKAMSKWKTMPDLMLQYRASAFFGRVHCPDVLIGLQSEYEIYDTEPNITEIQVDDPFRTKPTEETIPKEAVAEDAVIVKPELETETEKEPEEIDDNKCFSCKRVVTAAVKKFSVTKYGKPLCMDCQKFQ